METAEMRRSTLQRKDRDELTKIALALGGKPSTRAPKGELIDLILDLAAGGDAPPPAEGSETKNEPGADNTEAASDDNANDNANDRPDPGNRRRRRRGRDRDNRDVEVENWDGAPIPVAGHLDLRSEGYAFLRVNGFLPSRDDAYVPAKLVRQYGLRKGDVIAGPSRPANRNEKNPAIVSVEMVNGAAPDEAAQRPHFDDLTAVAPTEPLILAAGEESGNLTARVIDLIAPLAKGQRALVVAPPKTGKTTMLKQIIRSLEANHPDVHLIVLMVYGRPEEITEMKRAVTNGEVVASAFDRPTDEHVLIADLTIERAKRMVETGRDVCVILDSVTRLVRAHNIEGPQSGRSLAGGLDAASTLPARTVFGAARQAEEGGSITVIATASVETGAAMDDVIFEEFTGTTNMEIRLSRSLMQRRLFPAIDIAESGARQEESLFDDERRAKMATLRRELADLGESYWESLESLLSRLAATQSTDEFLASVASTPDAS